MKYVLLIISIIGYSMISNGQDMSFYADVMINAEIAEHRVLAADKFEVTFDTAIKEEGSFDDAYEDMPFIFVRYTDDRSFRTVTWQIDQGDGKFRYDGYLQQADGTISRLAGKRGKSAMSKRGSVDWTSWSGGIIYKLLSVPSQGKVSHYALTYRQIDAFTKVKTLESITIDGSKVVLSGEPIFANDDSNDHRILLQYSADSNCNLRYESAAEQLVFDNLIPVAGRIEGQGPTLVPDGSYKAYELQEDGSWKYIDKLYDQKFTSPPRGGISSGGKDLFGRDKKN